MTEPKPAQPEPNGCTMGDLMALTLGVAIAASLDWYSTRPDTSWIGNRMAPGWYMLANQGLEAIQKACVALVPLILARRVRYGGPLRPVEILPIVNAVFVISLAMALWPVFGLYHSSPTPPYLTSVHPEAYYLWEISELTLGALAGLVVLLLRKRPAFWARGVALAVAWQMLSTWLGYFYQQWASSYLLEWPTSIYVVLGSTFLVQWPQVAIAYLPTMIAIIDLVRPPGGRRTWVVWVVVAIALPVRFLYEARNLARMVLDPGNSLFDATRIASLILAVAMSFALARWTEPAWRRIFEGSTDRGGPD